MRTVKRFKFKLQAVLEHRRFQEDQLKVELAELMRNEARERTKLEELKRELEASRQILADKLQSGSDILELALLDEYVKTLRDDVGVQCLTVEAIGRQVDGKRSEVLEAMKRRKLLQALRDKQERAHLYESARVEQSELDNQTSVRFARTHTREYRPPNS